MCKTRVEYFHEREPFGRFRSQPKPKGDGADMKLVKQFAGVVVDDADSGIDKVLAHADIAGNLVIRQGGDHIILNPEMTSQILDFISQLTEKSKRLVAALFAPCMVAGLASIRFELWELGFYFTKIRDLMPPL